MKLFYLVAIGNVLNQSNQVVRHGSVICSFDSDLTEIQRQQVAEALGCANIDLIDKETYEKEYKN